MLLLTRRQGESIIINENITVTVISVGADAYGNLQAKLGVDAPKHIPVHREEIHNRIMAEKESRRG